MVNMTSVSITPQHPFPSFTLHLPSHLPFSCLPAILSPLCPIPQQSLSLTSGRSLPLSASLESHVDTTDHPIGIRLAVRLPGGKGGFASQLRAQGGRMSSNKATNNDSCRDLNGRRLATIKEAKKLADYLADGAKRDEDEKRRIKEKQEELELEIKRLDAAGAGQKRRLEDSKYVEESKEVVEGVRDAVKLAMLKKRKKAKLDTAVSSEVAPVASTSTSVLEPVENMNHSVEATKVNSQQEDQADQLEPEVAEDSVVEEKVTKGKSKGKAKAKARK